MATILRQFDSDDDIPENLLILEYRDGPDGDDPIFCGAVMIKDGAGLSPEQRHALIPGSLSLM